MATQLTPKQQQWAALIDQWSASGLTQAQFCQQRDIDPARFYAWKHLLTKKQLPADDHLSTTGPFLPVAIESARPSATITLTVNQVEVTYRPDINDQLLVHLLKLLKEVA